MSVSLLRPLRRVKQSFKTMFEPQELEDMGLYPQEWRSLAAHSYGLEPAGLFALGALAAPGLIHGHPALSAECTPHLIHA